MTNSITHNPPIFKIEYFTSYGGHCIIFRDDLTEAQEVVAGLRRLRHCFDVSDPTKVEGEE
jgi:hypothetical protein